MFSCQFYFGSDGWFGRGTWAAYGVRRIGTGSAWARDDEDSVRPAAFLKAFDNECQPANCEERNQEQRTGAGESNDADRCRNPPPHWLRWIVARGAHAFVRDRRMDALHSRLPRGRHFRRCGQSGRDQRCNTDGRSDVQSAAVWFRPPFSGTPPRNGGRPRRNAGSVRLRASRTRWRMPRRSRRRRGRGLRETATRGS